MHKRHRAKKSEDRGWTRCVEPGRCPNARTHGNIITVETCACGARREIEINGGASVASGWYREPAAHYADAVESGR